MTKAQETDICSTRLLEMIATQSCTSFSQNVQTEYHQRTESRMPTVFSASTGYDGLLWANRDLACATKPLQYYWYTVLKGESVISRLCTSALYPNGFLDSSCCVDLLARDLSIEAPHDQCRRSKLCADYHYGEMNAYLRAAA